LPSDASGNVTSYTGAQTNVKIFAGIIDDTENWTITNAPNAGIASVSTTNNGSTITVTNVYSNADTGYIDITAVKSGASITRRFTLTKSKQGATGNTGSTGGTGAAGAASKLLTLSATGQSITYNSQGALNPGTQTITLTANLQNMSGTATFSCSVKNSSNAEVGTIALGGSGNIRTLTGAQFNGVAAASYAVVSATLEGLTDTTTIVKLSEGQNGVTPVVGYLTNESSQVAADYLGAVASYASANGNFKVFNGLTDVSSTATYSVFSQTGTTGATISVAGAYTVGTMTADIATVTFRAVFGGVTIDKILTVTKSRAGIPGTNAELIFVTSDKQDFIFNSAGSPLPSVQTINFTANLKNISGTVTWSATGYDVNNVTTGSLTLTGSGNNRALSIANFGSNQYAVVSATLGGNTDYVSVVRIQQGINGVSPIVGYLTNESALLGASSTGVVTDFSQATGVFKVYAGITDVTTSTQFSTLSTSGLTVAINPTTGAYSVSAISQDAGTATFRATYGGVVIDKVLSVNKSRAGTAGSNASVLTITNTAQAFTYDGAGSAAPAQQTINIIANLQNLSGTATFTVTGYDSAGTPSSLSLGGSGNARTLSVAQFASSQYAVITATLSGFSDTVTIVRLAQGVNGQNAVTGFLTNENVTFAATSGGVVASFAGGSGQFKVYNGITDVTAQSTFSKPVADTNCSTVLGAGGAYTTQSLSSDQGSSTFRASYGGVVVDKIFTLSKSRSGADGAPGATGATGATGTKTAIIRLYQWSTVSPAVPNDVSAYDWSQGVHYYYGQFWTTAVAANPGTPGIKLWMAEKSITQVSNNNTLSNISWSGTYIVSVGANGLDGATGAAGSAGANGTKSVAVAVYKWNPTIPTAPVATLYYTWSSGAYSAPSGWSLAPPTAVLGNTLWKAEYIVTAGATAVETVINWGSASIFATGYAGSNGAQGPAGTGVQGASYRVCYTKTTLTSLGANPATYNTNGNNSFPPNSTWGAGTVWSGQPQQIVAGESVYQSDGIYDPVSNITTWYAPYLSSLKVGTLSAITANMGSITAGQMNINNNFIIDSQGNATIKGNADISGTLSASKIILRDTNGAASTQVFDATSGQALRNNPHVGYYLTNYIGLGTQVLTHTSLAFYGPNNHSGVSINKRLPKISSAEGSSVKLLVSISARIDHWMLPVVRLTGGTATETFYLDTGGTQIITYNNTWKPLGGTYSYNGYPASFSGITAYEGGYQQVSLQYIMNLNSFANDSILQFGLAITGRDDGVQYATGGVPIYIDGTTSGIASTVCQVRGQDVYNLQYEVVALT
jgi:hypothetical protein